jgi:hypothetical protein
MSRWERWTTKPKQGMSLGGFIAEQQSPAEMAQSMGLQSDGSGGYIDPETGQIAARTVNNELVFYDPMGGAISAQSDGAALTQAQPSWKDPVTGEITVPPGQAESPEEIAAIPDVVPAQAPASYNAFMNKKKKDMYAQQAPPEQEAIDDVQQEVDPQLGMQPEMPMGEELLTFSQMMEARRKAAPIKTTVDPNEIDPKAAEIRKKLEINQARRRAMSVDRRAGDIDDSTSPTRPDTIKNTSQRPISQRVTSSATDTEKPDSKAAEKSDVRQDAVAGGGKTFSNFAGDGGDKPPTPPPTFQRDDGDDDDDYKGDDNFSHGLLPFNVGPDYDQSNMAESPAYAAASYLANNKGQLNEGELLSHFEEILEHLDDNVKGFARPGQRRAGRQAKSDFVKILTERLGDINPKDKDAFMRAAILASFIAEEDGVGQKKIGSGELKAMANNRGLINEVYGGGDVEDHLQHVKDNISKFRPFAEGLEDDTVYAFLDLLQNIEGGKPYKRLETAGVRNQQDFQNYYLGMDENDDPIRGANNTADQKRQRAFELAKILLSQGGLDALTGMPLDFKSMRLDHFFPVQGEDQVMNTDAEHRDNFVWINDAINAAKAEDDIPKFLENMDKLGESGFDDDELLKIGKLFPATLDKYVDDLLTGETDNFEGRMNMGQDGGRQTRQIQYLNDSLTPELMLDSLQRGEKFADVLYQMKLDALEQWKDDQSKSRIEDRDESEHEEIQKLLDQEYNEILKETKAKGKPLDKMSRYLMRRLGIGATFDDYRYFTNNGEVKSSRGLELSGDRTKNGLFSAMSMSLVKKMQEAETPEEKKAVQKQFATDVEQCKDNLHEAFKPGKTNKRIKLSGGGEIKRHASGAVNDANSGQMEKPGASYKSAATQQFRRCLHSKGLVDNDEVKRQWDRDKTQMPELRNLIEDYEGRGLSQNQMAKIFSEIIDED